MPKLFWVHFCCQKHSKAKIAMQGEATLSTEAWSPLITDDLNVNIEPRVDWKNIDWSTTTTPWDYVETVSSKLKSVHFTYYFLKIYLNLLWMLLNSDVNILERSECTRWLESRNKNSNMTSVLLKLHFLTSLKWIFVVYNCKTLPLMLKEEIV